jgi:hypothetical protein
MGSNTVSTMKTSPKILKEKKKNLKKLPLKPTLSNRFLSWMKKW